MLRLIGRIYRAVGRAVICTCPYRENCPMFGERRNTERPRRTRSGQSGNTTLRQTREGESK